MRRVVGLILAALVVLAGAAALGAWMLTRLGPDTLRARAEAGLSELLGTEVRLGPVALRLAPTGLVASAAGFEAWSGPDGPALAAERLELQLDPWSLALGEVDPGWVSVHGALLRLRREGDALRLALPPGASLPPRGDGAALSLERALGRVLERVPLVELTAGRAVVAAGPGALPSVVVEQLDGTLARRWLRGGVAVDLAGALRSDGDPAGRFELSARADGGWSVRARVEELALAALAALAPAAARGRIPAGRASGTWELDAPEGGPASLRFALEAPRLRPPWEAAAPLANVTLAGALRAAEAPDGATQLTLAARTRAADADVPLELEAVRTPAGALRLEQLSFSAPLDLARLASVVEALPEPIRARARDVLPHVRAGRLVGAELAWDGAAEDARSLRARGRIEGLVVEVGAGRLDGGAGELALAGDVLRVTGGGGRLSGEPAALAALLPEPLRERARAALARVDAARLAGVELRWPLAADAPLAGASVRARLLDASLRIGSRSRLEALGAQLAYEGGTLTLSGVEGRLDGRPLPALEARIEGADALAELRCVEPEPVPALPGRRPLVEWVRGPKERRGGPPSWQRVRVEAEWLAHPALGCVVEDLAGSLEPVEGGGMRLAIERAVWAGHAVRGTLEHRVEAPESVHLDARVGEPVAARRPASAGAWSRGRFHLASQRLGKWDARSAEGGFRLEGVQLALEDVALALDPGPVIDAEITLDLTRADAVPFHADAQIPRGEFGDLLRAMTDTTEPSVTGGFVGAISLRGALRPGHPTLGDADGGFSLHLRDGLIRQRFRLLLAVAMASETLNPFREQGTIRFGAMDAIGTLADGSWMVDTLQIDGPALRVLAHGRVGAVAPNQVEGVMGLFFFRTLDRAIGLVPLVNQWLLGGDRNFLGAYVALSGPWSAISARVLPVKSLASGPASVVLEGVPTALQGGVRAIERMLQAVTSAPTGEAQPRADSRAPSRAPDRGAGS